MVKELETIALSRDIPEYGLKAGDIGVVVHCYGEGDTFEIEFVTAEGETIAVLTLSDADIRQVRGKEVLHVRTLEQVAI
ncbi:DUF4926 domain-containing protein [Thermodesulfobacteriota bacterium]